MPIEETWVYKQAMAAKSNAMARDEHARKVVKALKKQQAAYQDWKATHDERERLYALDYENEHQVEDVRPPQPMPTSNVALDYSQRDAVSRAEKAKALMGRRPPPPAMATPRRSTQIGYKSEFSSPYG